MGTLSTSKVRADLARLPDRVKPIDHCADSISIDNMDAHFVPPLLIGPVVVASSRPHTDYLPHAHFQGETPKGLLRAPHIAAEARDHARVEKGGA